ncbi:MAG: glycosyltransferase family 39 protein [Chloroflexota bacterium]|nr:glycosyltransferase family 39 protein [Chloroflexota bacterium]
MTRLQRWLRSGEARWIIAVFLLALGVRLALVAYVHPSPRDGRYDDSVFFDSAARHLAAGDGYVFDPAVWKAPDGAPIYPGQHDLTATALWPPGYPATLAVVYKLTGDSLWAARLLNVLLGALTPVLVFLIARRLFDLNAAAFAGVTLAVLPGHVLYTSVLLTETSFGFLVALVLAVCVYFVFRRERANLPLIAGVGALTAFTGYVRGEFLAFGLVLALFLLLAYGRRAALPLAALALGAAVIAVPWVVRNAVQMGEPIVGTTGLGRALYQGNSATAADGTVITAAAQLGRPSAAGRAHVEVTTNSEYLRLAREWALHHKLQELKLIPIRLYYLFQDDAGGVTAIQGDKPWFGASGADRLSRLSSFTFFGLVALALAGAPFWARRRDLRLWLVFSIVPLYMLLFGVLFVGDPRYHDALYLPLSILGSVTLAEIWRMTAEGWRAVAGGGSLRPASHGPSRGR